MVFLMLRDNPPAPGSTAVVALNALVNARRQLAAPYSARDGFPGYCIASSMFVVPVSVAEGPEGADDLRTLRKVMDIIRKEYAHQKTLAALLAIMPQLVEILIAQLSEGGQSGIV